MKLDYIVRREEDFKNKLQEHMEKARLQCKAELREREGKIAAKELQVGGLTWLSHLITAARITWIIRVLCGSWQVIAYFKYNSQLKKLLENLT